MKIGPDSKVFISVSARPGRFGATVYAALFERCCIDAVYLPRPAPVDAREIVAAIRGLDLAGCSVSSPHKTAIIEHLDRITHEARTANAVNTITRDGAGQLVGACTDIDGIRGSLRDAGITGERALIYGAGGVVGPAVVALRSLGFTTLSVTARRVEAMEQAAARWGLRAYSLDVQRPERFDLLINATPVGRSEGDAPDLILALEQSVSLLDMTVSTMPTAIIDAARASGMRTVDGVSMCVHQIAAQAKLYLGEAAMGSIGVTEIEQIVREHYLGHERSF
ncbi:MAG: hypothetical protein AAGB51_01400 [Planctomycetota bacterium]